MDTGTTFFTAQARTRCQQKADRAGFGAVLGGPALQRDDEAPRSGALPQADEAVQLSCAAPGTFVSVSLTVPVLPWRSLTKQSHPDITYTLKNTAGQVRAVLDVTGLPVEVPDAQSILGDFVISNKQYMLSSQEGLACCRDTKGWKSSSLAFTRFTA